MKTWLKILLPIALLGTASGGTVLMLAFKPKPEIQPVPPRALSVQVWVARTHTESLQVQSRGMVRPRTETTLVAEVAGRIAAIAPALEAGAFVRAGDLLLQIDNADLRAVLAQAESNLAQARLRLAQEEARGEQARREWTTLGQGEEPSPLVLRIPQVEAERAAVRHAAELVAKAERDLERSRIVAPYDGLIREKRADLGQFVSPGTPLLSIAGTERAEIRLPLQTAQLSFLPILQGNGSLPTENQPPVLLRGSFGGQEITWRGRIVRTEGVIDARSRMMHAVAVVDDPYQLKEGSTGSILPFGLFVEAQIEGATAHDLVVLPRFALRSPTTVLVVDGDNRLRTREVTVLKLTDRDAYLNGGLDPGEKVCLTAVEFVVEGMLVAPTVLELPHPSVMAASAAEEGGQS